MLLLWRHIAKTWPTWGNVFSIYISCFLLFQKCLYLLYNHHGAVFKSTTAHPSCIAIPNIAISQTKSCTIILFSMFCLLECLGYILYHFRFVGYCFLVFLYVCRKWAWSCIHIYTSTDHCIQHIWTVFGYLVTRSVSPSVFNILCFLMAAWISLIINCNHVYNEPFIHRYIGT